ncbi:hypothetical protein IW492_06195 [Enterococcus sp. BWB1-3]|uniref:hypothetical protein n=1 Tax=unclassified Enterococcus TaxID=2608891 RepID=UPI0019235C9A|nr:MULTISPECIES: hypothetical protein [unclassified Enterococcus]MBL1228823.1 hypothetical protein [Enterococcus sp. BWB1-3]MCB5951634.1 hypothetical protein [Enterococcus sp. BWT-B8]MCB5954726.1 hypothetical protein [Enterococcus sp. CWB-B31]
MSVSERQSQYLPSNIYSLAESKFEDAMSILAIYKEEIPIGFLAYQLDDVGDLNLLRFMISHVQQSKGYGK